MKPHCAITTSFASRSQSPHALAGLTLGLALTLSGQAYATGTTELPFDMPALSTLQASDHLIFTHWFTPFREQMNNDYPDDTWQKWLHPTSTTDSWYANGGRVRQTTFQHAALPKGVDWQFENDMHEVRTAEAAGIDGWTIYYGQYNINIYPNAKVMMQAVSAASDHFKSALNPDMSDGIPWTDSGFEQAIKDLGSMDSAFRLADGRLLVTPFLAENRTPEWYVARFNNIEATSNIKIAFMPLFLSYGNLSSFVDNTTLQNSGYLYGASTWGGSVPGQNSNNMNAAHNAGLVYMNVARPDSVRPKSNWYDEVQNTTTYRDQWTNSINNGAEWTNIVTWSDFGEGTELEPGTSKTYAFIDLTAYYAAWYKSETSERPEIVRDAFYGVYRTQSTQATPEDTSIGNMSLNQGAANFNKIEMLAFVKDIPVGESVTLKVEIAGHSYSKVLHQSDIAATGGLFSYKVDLPVGLNDATADAPVFTLIRNGVIVSQQTGYWDVNDNITVDDFLYHGQSSLRPNPFTSNQFALSSAYRWTNPNAATNPNSSNYDAAYNDPDSVKLRIQEDRSPFPRLTNDQAIKYTDTSSTHGSQGGMGYSFNKTIDNATGGTPPTSVAFDFNVLDPGGTGTGALQPMAKLSNASSTSTTITDGVILKLFADDGQGHHVLAYEPSGSNNFITLTEMFLTTDTWYRIIIDFGNLGTASDKFNLTLAEAGGDSYTWNGLTFYNNVAQLTQLALFNNATDASLGSFAIDNVYVGTTLAPIPEPATLGLLAIGSILILRRGRGPHA